MDYFEHMSEVLKALGHPLRLQIVELLRQEEEACVCHLEHRLGQRQAYISQQLARLREAGLVVDRREGMNVYYSLSSDAPKEVLIAVKRTLDEVGGQSLPPVDNAEASLCHCPRCQAQYSTPAAQADPLLTL